MRNHSRIRNALVLASVLLPGLLAAARREATPPDDAQLHWIVSADAIERLKAAPHPAGLIEQAFDNDRTWLIAGPRPPDSLKTWHCRRVIVYRSYADMKKGLDTPAETWGVLYDPEDWAFTPPAERLNVPKYAAQAAQLVHAKGLSLIVTPATDLAHALDPGRGTFADRVRTLVRLDLARQVAPSADVYEIQSQGAEPDSNLFVYYVTQEAAQVRSANPHAVLLAGLSTNPHGLHVTAKQVIQEVMATQHIVQGYWLNVPSGGPACPTCGIAQPQVAIQLLESLRDKGLL